MKKKKLWQPHWITHLEMKASRFDNPHRKTLSVIALGISDKAITKALARKAGQVRVGKNRTGSVSFLPASWNGHTNLERGDRSKRPRHSSRLSGIEWWDGPLLMFPRSTLLMLITECNLPNIFFAFLPDWMSTLYDGSLENAFRVIDLRDNLLKCLVSSATGWPAADSESDNKRANLPFGDSDSSAFLSGVVVDVYVIVGPVYLHSNLVILHLSIPFPPADCAWMQHYIF